GRQQWRRAVSAGFGDEAFEIGLVGGEGANAFAALLLVVVAHLNEEIIAGPDDAHEFGETVLALKAPQRLTGFAVVGDGDLGLEETGQHLAPAVEGLARLVGGGRVACDEKRGDVGRLLHRDDAARGMFADEFERNPIVPSPYFRFLLARFELHFAAAGDLRTADIHEERTRFGLTRGDADLLEHQAPQFGFDRCHGIETRIAERHRNAIVAFFGYWYLYVARRGGLGGRDGGKH